MKLICVSICKFIHSHNIGVLQRIIYHGVYSSPNVRENRKKELLKIVWSFDEAIEGDFSVSKMKKKKKKEDEKTEHTNQ